MMEANGLVQGYSFWTFTDIFEENYFPGEPFQGGFGLLNLHGVAKPSYRAFELLHRLGTEQCLVDGLHERWMPGSFGSRRAATVLLANHALPRHPIETEQVHVQLTGRPPPRNVYVERIDERPRERQAPLARNGQAGVPQPREVEQLQRGIPNGAGAATVEIRRRDASSGTCPAAPRGRGHHGGIRAGAIEWRRQRA